MKIVPVLLICLLASSLLHAQYVEENADSSLTKNAFGAYLSSPVAVMLKASPVTTRLGFMYKRQIRPERALRFQGIIDYTRGPDEWDEVLVTINQLTDSTITYDWTSRREQNYSLRGGLEWSDPDKDITPIYGVDFIAGMRYVKDWRGDATYDRDTTTTDIAPAFGTGRLDYTAKNTTRTYVVGFDATIGWRFRIKRNWEFIAQFTPEITVAVYEDVQDDLAGTRTNGGRSQFYFETQLLELLLFYRF